MQRTQFRAKSAQNDRKPTYFLKRNFYFETDGVISSPSFGFVKLLQFFKMNMTLTTAYTVSRAKR